MVGTEGIEGKGRPGEALAPEAVELRGPPDDDRPLALDEPDDPEYPDEPEEPE